MMVEALLARQAWHLPSPGRRAPAARLPHRKQAARPLTRKIAARSEGLLGALRFWGRPGGSSGGKAGAAKQQLLEELRSPKPDKQRIGEACDALIAAKVPFKEALLGGGPSQVVFTRGPLLWQLSTQSGSRVSSATGNQAWQDFRPSSKEVVNYGELLGSSVFATASGSYQAADEERLCPKLVRASIERGALSVWGLEIPLPIRGQGLVYVAYLDDQMRIFQATNGSLSVQVRQDLLPKLLGRG